MDSRKFFGKGKEVLEVSKKKVEWDWERFQSTKGFPVSKNLLDWVIGQDKALEECYLCLEEWVHKLKYLKKIKWWKDWEKPELDKPVVKEKLSPGPYLLLLGDPGTGKSLIGRALAFKLTELYKEHGISLVDILCWKNPKIPSEPLISIKPAGEGRKVVIREKLKEARKQFWKTTFFRLLQGLLIVSGISLLAVGFYFLGHALWTWFSSPDIQLTYNGDFLMYVSTKLVQILPFSIVPGGSLLFFGVFIGWISRLLGKTGFKGIGGAEASDTPKLLVDNSSRIAPFVDATGHTSSQLFGSIAWDPYQTGGLGTPEHQRVTAGDVHRASLGILYIDEIKNLHPEEAITLLTVLEDGQLPVTLRDRWHGGGTAAMSVSTQPIPAVTFLVAAGNFDSIRQIHPALMDRIFGYGKVVRMNNDMPNTIKNRRKLVQFIAQETHRFNLPPFSREACIEIIEEARRRSNKRNALTTKFRPLISIIKTSAILAVREGKNLVEAKHVKEAIEEHCKTIQKQILEHHMEEKEKFLVVDPSGKKLGEIYGLAVVSDPVSEERTGTVLRLKAQLIKKSRLKGKGDRRGFFKVTGVTKSCESFIEDSIAKVRSVILHKYKVDIAQDYMTHLDFSQSYLVDGPSAGVTMALALCSLLEGKPLRQEIAVTGEINISSTDEVEITPVGGLYEKIKAAERWGFKAVIIPERNYHHSINPKDFKIRIIPAKTLDDYLKELLS